MAASKIRDEILSLCQNTGEIIKMLGEFKFKIM